MKDTSTAVSHYLCGGKVPGHRIPREEGRLTFLGRCSVKTYKRGRLRGVHFLTGRNGEREGAWGRGGQGNLIYLQFNKKMEPDCDVKLNQHQLRRIKALQLYLPFFLFPVLVLSSSRHLYLFFFARTCASKTGEA